MRCRLWGLRIFADLVAMSFDQHNKMVLDMMRNMSFLPSMGLGRRQYGSREFIAIPDRDVPFGLGFIPTKIGDMVDGTVPYDEYIDEMFVMSTSQIDGIVQPELASPFDLFGVFAIE
ncbi:hypothetical protein AAG906_029894 [Vitis piasezkii]